MLIAYTTESLSSDGWLSKLRDVIEGFVIDLDEACGVFPPCFPFLKPIVYVLFIAGPDKMFTNTILLLKKIEADA